MESQEKLKKRFNELHEQYAKLKHEYIKLKEAYCQVVEINLQESKNSKLLREENEDLKKKLKETLKDKENLENSIAEANVIENADDFARTICAKRRTLIQSITMFSPQRVQEECFLEKSNSGKTPQANPDQSIAADVFEPCMYEAFFILGSTLDSEKPEILFEQCLESTVSGSAKRVLGEFCFPLGMESKKLGRGQVKNWIMNQGRVCRDSNFYIFTLKYEDNGDWAEFTDIPNGDKELLYCVCLQVDDLVGDSETFWVVPRCYCFISFIPVFELHFEVLKQIVEIKRSSRLQVVKNYTRGIPKQVFLAKEEANTDQLSLLEEYANCDCVYPGYFITINSPLSNIHYQCELDLSVIDIGWLCPSLFSAVSLEDLVFLMSALAQEKSIIFVSHNLGLMTSCVLGLQALLRPLKWPHVLIPVIPNSLRDLVEAPVPLLAGLPGSYPTKKNQLNVIWVLLDEPRKSKKIQGPLSVIKEVQEPNALELRQKLNYFYSAFEENKLYKQKPNSIEIANCWKEYWKGILNSVSSQEESFVNHPEGKFLEPFVQSQMFINSLEER